MLSYNERRTIEDWAYDNSNTEENSEVTEMKQLVKRLVAAWSDQNNLISALKEARELIARF